MPNVIVTPPSVITVRVGPAAPAQVQTSASFVGASDQLPLIQEAENTANLALEIANTALNEVVGAYAEANSAYALAANSLPITGGEITGNLIVDGEIYGMIATIDAGMF
jgi:hypothetical protein